MEIPLQKTQNCEKTENKSFCTTQLSPISDSASGCMCVRIRERGIEIIKVKGNETEEQSNGRERTY